MSKKIRGDQFTEAQLVKELKSCMRCKYFWGNNHRCANGACQKKSGKEIKNINAKITMYRVANIFMYSIK